MGLGRSVCPPTPHPPPPHPTRTSRALLFFWCFVGFRAFRLPPYTPTPHRSTPHRRLDVVPPTPSPFPMPTPTPRRPYFSHTTPAHTPTPTSKTPPSVCPCARPCAPTRTSRALLFFWCFVGFRAFRLPPYTTHAHAHPEGLTERLHPTPHPPPHTPRAPQGLCFSFGVLLGLGRSVCPPAPPPPTRTPKALPSVYTPHHTHPPTPHAHLKGFAFLLVFCWV